VPKALPAVDVPGEVVNPTLLAAAALTVTTGLVPTVANVPPLFAVCVVNV